MGSWSPQDAIRILTGGLCMAQTADGGYVSLLPDPPARLMDHRVCPSTCALVPWLPEDVPQGLEVDVAEDGALLSLRGVSQLVVPSASLAAFAYMLDRLVRSGGHVLVLGAGTWVTTNLTRHVLHHLPAQKFVALNTSLSACTRCASESPTGTKRLGWGAGLHDSQDDFKLFARPLPRTLSDPSVPLSPQRGEQETNATKIHPVWSDADVSRSRLLCILDTSCRFDVSRFICQLAPEPLQQVGKYQGPKRQR